MNRREFLLKSSFAAAGGALVAPAGAAPIAGPAPDLPPGTPWLPRPWPRDPAKFSFAVVGDKTGGGLDQWPVFDRAIDEINRLRPDFALMVGDLIQGYTTDIADCEAEWTEFLSHANRCEVPFLFFPGNHDISNPAMLSWWRSRIGATYYSFVYKDCLFLALNTQEHWDAGGVYLGPSQTQWAIDTLAEHADVRHTFLFIHVPQWRDSTLADYQRIDTALASRASTVFAGHEHQLAFEHHRGRDYIDMGCTGAMLSPHPLKSLGLFHHFSMVTVEDKNVHIAHVEPGSIWPKDVAPYGIQQGVARLLDLEALPVEGLGTTDTRPGFSLTVRNVLPGAVRIRLAVTGAGAARWVGEAGWSHSEEIAAGATGVLEHRFEVKVGDLLPAPQLRAEAVYDGNVVAKFQRNLGLAPESALREIPEWRVAGPFLFGPMPSNLPDNPRVNLAHAYKLHGAEKGETLAPALLEEGKPVGWTTMSVQSQYGAGFLNLLNLFVAPEGHGAYVACRVRSPGDRIVYARLRVDAYGQVFVNGLGINDEELYRTRSDPVWVALPLRAGWNDVVVKCISIRSGWSQRLLLLDPAGELEIVAGGK
jgi:hypothetical protein